MLTSAAPMPPMNRRRAAAARRRRAGGERIEERLDRGVLDLCHQAISFASA